MIMEQKNKESLPYLITPKLFLQATSPIKPTTMVKVELEMGLNREGQDLYNTSIDC